MSHESRGRKLEDYKTGASRPSGHRGEPKILGHGDNHLHFIARMKMDLRSYIQYKEKKEKGLEAVVITQAEIDRAKQEFYKK